MRNTIVVGAALGLLACAPKVADLGGSEAGVNESSSSTNDGGDDYVGPTTCDATANSGPFSDGSGFQAEPPPACSQSDGAAQSFPSSDAVQAAVVGTWYDCGATGNSVLRALGGTGDAIAIELTADGRYMLLQSALTGPYTVPTSDTLAPFGIGGWPEAGIAGTPITSTYQVIDASATLGPGTFQIQLQVQGGGTLTAQVVLLAGPTKMRFVYSNGPSTEEFSPALPLTFRTGVCNYQGPDSFGPPLTSLSDPEIVSHLQGAWVGCAGDGDGYEFPGDGTWYFLVSDTVGNLSRSTAANGHGTLSVKDGELTLITSPPTYWQPQIPVFAACESTLGFTTIKDPVSGLGGQPPQRGEIYQRTTKSY